MIKERFIHIITEGTKGKSKWKNLSEMLDNKKYDLKRKRIVLRLCGFLAGISLMSLPYEVSTTGLSTV